MKKLVSVILVVALTFVLSSPALAATANDIKTYSEMQQARVIEQEVKDLWSQYVSAKSDDERNTLFLKLVDEYEKLDSFSYYTSEIASLASGYVSIDSISIGSNQVTFKYTVTTNIPSLATVNIGWEYPADQRRPSVIFQANRTPGTYTHTVSKKADIYCRFYTELIARDYTSKDVHSVNYGGLEDGRVRTSTHTVTKDDVIGSNIATLIVFTTITALLKDARWYYALAAFGGVKIVGEIKDTFPLAEKQFIVWSCWMNTNTNTFYFTQNRYSSESSYKAGDEPLFSDNAQYTAIW